MRPFALTSALALCLLAAGCVSAGDPSSTPTVSTTPTASPTPTAEDTPDLPMEVYNKTIDFSSDFGDGTLGVPPGAKTLQLFGTWHSSDNIAAANPKFQILDELGVVAMECALGIIAGGSAEGMTCEDEIEVGDGQYRYKYDIGGQVTLDVVVIAN